MLAATSDGANASVEVLVRPPDPGLESWSSALVECFATLRLPPRSNGLQWSLRHIPASLGGIFNVTQDVLNNPTNVHAAGGHGALTATWSASGALTGLRWPEPASPDQVDYMATNRSLAEMGARPNMGVFQGVRLRSADGST